MAEINELEERWKKNPVYMILEHSVNKLGDHIMDREGKVWLAIEAPEKYEDYGGKAIYRYKVVAA